MATAHCTCGSLSLHVTNMATTIWPLLVAHLVVCYQLSHEPQMATHNFTFWFSSITYYWRLRRHFQFHCWERERVIANVGDAKRKLLWECCVVAYEGCINSHAICLFSTVECRNHWHHLTFSVTMWHHMQHMSRRQLSVALYESHWICLWSPSDKN